MAFMRKSKFRHVFGKALKKDQCYDDLRVSRSSWDSKFVAVNPKFVAVITEGGGGSSFIVLSLSKVGRVDINAPLVGGHKGPVFDIAWSPHNDNLIASCSDDCTVKIWQIPEEGLSEHMTDPLLTLAGHQKRVTSIVWHPTAYCVLATTGSDNRILFWNVETGEPLLEIGMPDQIFSMSFNEDGSLFACTCKDKKLRIVDSHTGEVVKEIAAHEGAKPPQCAFLKNNKVLTSGFSKMSERQYALWDVKKDKLECIERADVDSSNGVMFIFYDPDANMFYLAGKGDCQVRYYEVTEEAPYVHYLSSYTTSSPQKGVAFMPKRGVNAKANEISRYYKLHNGGLLEVTSFTVPRKSELFQHDLYPPTASDEPTLTANDFFAGQNALPKMISLHEDAGESTFKTPRTVVRKSNVIERTPQKVATQNTSSNGAEDTSVAASALPPRNAISRGNESGVSAADMSEIKKEIEELKKTISEQDKRIVTLEGRLASLEQSNNTDEEDATA